MRFTSHGAAQGVTGSCHLLEAAGLSILVDCGLFQGSRELRDDNAEPFGFDPASIDFLLLTHAHLDHCGRIPLLVDQGFHGEIICTSATRELARLVLEDTARLQEQEADRSRRHAKRGQRNYREDAEPLYDSLAVARCLEAFGREADYGLPIELSHEVRVTFQDAGHILGSASLVLDIHENGTDRRVVFSGDLGSPFHPIVRDPKPCPATEVVVMECTYGGRRHRGPMQTAAEFYGVLRQTLSRGGNVVIPTFALERAQELLFALREGREHGILPEDMRVFVDSPMATSATEIFSHHPECFDDHAKAVMEAHPDLFTFPGLAFTRDRTESKAINTVRSGAVILAGSGMCTGGRVLHHLEQLLPRPECAVVFVGYAGKGTLARTIIDGAKTARLFGQEVPIRAQVHTINGFSGHADHGGLLRWIEGAGKPKRTILVHGDIEALQALGGDLSERGHSVEIPAAGTALDLD